MDAIEKQVRRAQRRLGLQRFVGLLGWTCTATLGAAAVLVLIDRFWPLGLVVWAWLGGAAVLGLIMAWIWAVATARGPIDAAVEIDRRFGLKERVSSTLALSPEDRETPSGQALIKDAARRVERINVSDRMKVTAPRRLLYPLIPVAFAMVFLALIGPSGDGGAAQAKAGAAKVQKQIKKSAKKLDQQIAQQRKKAERQGLKEIRDVLKLLQRDLKKLQENPPADRKEALKKLNDLAKQLQQQREKFSGAEGLRDQLKQLNQLKQGPADKLAKALKQGDFKKAAEELEKLRREMASDKLSDEQRRQMAQQLKQMAEKLQKMADAHDQMQERLADEIKKLRDAGEADQANQLEEQLAKLRSKLPQMDMLDQLGKQLEQCSENCEQGQLGEAQQAMEQLADNLEGLQQQMDQLETLDQAMDQVANCRCQLCDPNKEGGEGQAMMGQTAMEGGLKAGKGHVPGGRRGKELDSAFHDSQVRPNVGRGPMKMVDYVDGPNRKGEVGEAIHDQVESVKSGQTDPMTDQQMPRRHRQNAQEYLERLREGK